MTKYTFEYVKNFFETEGCELLETEYKNCDFKIKYKCNCGNISETTFYTFKNGGRCRKCGIEKRIEKRKLSYDYVKNFFQNEGCVLITKNYINAHQKLEYICNCKNNSIITFNSFQQGCRCNNCGILRASEKLRHSYEYVKNFFKIEGCELLSSTYKNSDTKLKYRCNCGNISEIVFSSFKQGVRCSKCGGSEKLKIKNVKEFFKIEKCELLEDNYINARSLMKYKCNCKNISFITYDSFRRGTRCMDCSFERSSETSKSFKDYKTPSGDIRRIQGYENIALDELLKNFNENEILTDNKDMPKIIYYLDKERRYFTDIYIPKHNKIIEVKSTYTYKKDLIKNIMKAFAARKLGYDFEFWIYNQKGIKLIL